jgi:sterol desaturase/sphingolipid hydroxylase (fatty acid hydroxylase superfamily)
MQRNPIRYLYDRTVDGIVHMSQTKTNYWAELVLDICIVVGFVSYGVWTHALDPFISLLFVIGGLVVFTFIEYFFHRWLFHGRVKIMEQGHSAHHAEPLGYDSLPFFVPALVMIAWVSFFSLILPLAYNLLLSAAILAGYIVYVLAHFSIHHWRPRNRYVRKWAAYHHIHHYHPEYNFGVTTPLWDILLGTRYRSRHKRAF